MWFYYQIRWALVHLRWAFKLVSNIKSKINFHVLWKVAQYSTFDFFYIYIVSNSIFLYFIVITFFGNSKYWSLIISSRSILNSGTIRLIKRMNFVVEQIADQIYFKLLNQIIVKIARSQCFDAPGQSV